MQAAQYKPEPLDLNDIVLPKSMEPVIEFCARNFHEVWVTDKLDKGWTWGAERDNVEKRHPSLVSWLHLQDGDKAYNRKAARNMFKMTQKLGYVVVMPENVHDEVGIANILDSWIFGDIDPTSNMYVPHACVGNLDNMTDASMAHALHELIDDIAEHLHESWSRQLMDDGWRFGQYNKELKFHHGLIPYAYLSAPEKEMNTAGVKTLFEALLVLGFSIVSAHEVEVGDFGPNGITGSGPIQVQGSPIGFSASSSSLLSERGASTTSRILDKLEAIERRLNAMEKRMH